MTRSVWKGPFVHPSLLKKIDKLKDSPNKKPKQKYYDVDGAEVSFDITTNIAAGNSWFFVALINDSILLPLPEMNIAVLIFFILFCKFLHFLYFLQFFQ